MVMPKSPWKCPEAVRQGTRGARLDLGLGAPTHSFVLMTPGVLSPEGPWTGSA